MMPPPEIPKSRIYLGFLSSKVFAWQSLGDEGIIYYEYARC